MMRQHASGGYREQHDRTSYSQKCSYAETDAGEAESFAQLLDWHCFANELTRRRKLLRSKGEFVRLGVWRSKREFVASLAGPPLADQS